MFPLLLLGFKLTLFKLLRNENMQVLSSTTKLLSLGQILRSFLTVNCRWLQRACLLNKGLWLGWGFCFEMKLSGFNTVLHYALNRKAFCMHAAWKDTWPPSASYYLADFIQSVSVNLHSSITTDRSRGTPMLLTSLVFPRHLFQAHTLCELILPKRLV